MLRCKDFNDINSSDPQSEFLHNIMQRLCIINYRLFSTSDSLGTGDLANILQAAWKARVEWYNIGLALCISSDTLDVIKSENHHVVKDCFREMLKEWLKSEPPPTWTELVEALKSPIVEYEELAEAITHRPF